MRGSSLIASVTLLSFTTLIVWPRGAWAEGQTKPPEAKAADAAKPADAAKSAETAPANDDATMAQAKQHFETGRNAYNAGDYVTAIREFKAAEQLRPSPILDYNIGLANEKLGKRRVAVKYYKRYLEEQPNAANKAEVEQKVAALEADIAKEPPPAATTTPGGTAPQPGSAQGEQPGDMPPADTNAQAGAAAAGQPGYDPYSSTAPPGGQPVAAKPAKKKSYWWIGLIIGGAVTLTIVIAVVIWVYASTTTTVYGANHGLTSTGPNGLERHDLGGLTVLRF